MNHSVNIALAQLNLTVGALNANGDKIVDWLGRAKRQGASLVLFPELTITGYPPEDLLFNPSFIRDNRTVLRHVAAAARGIAALVGFVDRDKDGALYNAAAVLAQGRVLTVYRKMKLPNYGVFDERRYFSTGSDSLLLRFGRTGPIAGLSICEDIWVEDGPFLAEAKSGASLLLNLSASPFHAGKWKVREQLLVRRARATKTSIAYVNLVGGQDELVFDGGSMVADSSGIRYRAPQFEESLSVHSFPAKAAGDHAAAVFVPVPVSARKISKARSTPRLSADREIFQALVLGLKDYAVKNGFEKVVFGMSGGIDSALTAALAVAALGKENVTAVSMPSRYSSDETRSDARAVSKALGIRFLEIPIEPAFAATLQMLYRALGKPLEGLPAENLQARIRGLLLMALSNKNGWLVLTTGNKSELSTGYCTLYGDMVGGFAPIKDLPKKMVYQLCGTANRFFKKSVIPRSVFVRAPTAELRFNQTDQDTLPPYDLLDQVVRLYVEGRVPLSELKKKMPSSKINPERLVRMINLNEYKRRQAAVGVKITPLAFGRDRRMPITNGYREK